MLVQAVRPPRERGTRWSKVSSVGRERLRQYWQAKRSRRKTLNRVKGGRRSCGMYCFSATTLGRRSSKPGERIDAVVVADHGHPVEEDRLDRFLPVPQGERVVVSG